VNGAIEPRYAGIVLTGGTAGRIRGVDKASFIGPSGRSMLARAVDACRNAERVVVVGPLSQGGLPQGRQPVLWTCEVPIGSGPARAIAAGVGMIDEPGVEWALVLAGDMPFVDEVVPFLLASAAQAPECVDGIVATVGGRRQWLCSVYRLPPLRVACGRLPRLGGGETVKTLTYEMILVDMPVPASSVQDIDTPADLVAAGYRMPRARHG